MIVWTVVSPPIIETPTFYTNYFSVGSCQTTTGDLIAICVQIVVLLYAVQLAFSVRDAPANFNESKVIVFATYNWAVFIGIGIVVAEFAITDPEISFIISSIAIFVPSLAHTLCLTGYKVYLCISNPDAAANVRSYNNESTESRPGKSMSGSGENSKMIELTLPPRTPGEQQKFSFEGEGSPGLSKVDEVGTSERGDASARGEDILERESVMVVV